MSSTVTFYNTSDDPRTIGKTLNQIGDSGVSVDIKGTINILYPTFTLKWNSSLTGANYFLWNGRYYFITDITLSSAKQMSISGAVDVLETYSTSILNSEGNCIRWENATNASGEVGPTFVIDKSLPIEENRSENINVNFGNKFPGITSDTDPQFVLLTI